MKFKGLLAGAIILILTFGQAGAVEVYVKWDGPGIGSYFGYDIICPDWGSVDYYIQMNNDDGFTREYATMAFTLYGTGAVDSLRSIDVEMINGFEPGGFWDINSELIEMDWDYNLPNSIVFIGQASSGNGWPSGLGVQNYMHIQFEVHLDEWAVGENYGEVCLDSTGFGEPYDWLFEPPYPDFSAICLSVEGCYWAPPQFLNCPTEPLTSNYSADFSYHFLIYGGTSLETFELISGPGSIDVNTGEWLYDPDISEAGDSYNAIIEPCDPEGCGNTCNFTLTVEDACGDFNADMSFNILDITATINYIYKGGVGPAHYYHGDVSNSDNINVLDVTRMIDVLYKGGEELVCSLIRDEFPLRSGTWWKYERFDSLTSVYDTVLVSVAGSNVLRYIYSTDTVYENTEIHSDTITTSGIYPNRVYHFPLQVGNGWDGIEYWTPSVDSVIAKGSTIVPAGTFDNIYFIKRVWGCGDECAAEMWEYYKPETGMVKMELREYDLMDGWYTDETWSLIEYNIP